PIATTRQITLRTAFASDRAGATPADCEVDISRKPLARTHLRNYRKTTIRGCKTIMRNLLVLALLVLCGCGSEPRVPPSSEMAQVVTLPMQLDEVHASIEVTVNGRPARLLLDTGADQIVLSATAAQRLGLPVRSTGTRGFGAAGTYTAST